MRLGDPLHLGSLLLAVGAVLWAMQLLLGFLFVLGVAAFVAAAILLLVSQRTRRAGPRPLAHGSILVLAVHGFLLLLFILATPLKIGKQPNVGINLNPPAWPLETIEALAPVYLLVLPAAFLLALFRTWGPIERTLGSVGVAVIAVTLLVVFFGPPPSPTAEPGWLDSLALAAGFLAVAAAAVLPPILAQRPPWTDTTRAAPPRPPQETPKTS